MNILRSSLSRCHVDRPQRETQQTSRTTSHLAVSDKPNNPWHKRHGEHPLLSQSIAHKRSGHSGVRICQVRSDFHQHNVTLYRSRVGLQSVRHTQVLESLFKAIEVFRTYMMGGGRGGGREGFDISALATTPQYVVGTNGHTNGHTAVKG